MSFFLNKFKLSRKKVIPVETLALPTRKEPSINKKIHMVGKKTCPLLFHLLLSHGFSAAGGWRGARGISAFLWDQSLEPALSLEQWAQPGPAVPGRPRCSAPAFIFVRAWSGGGGDQVTVPEERLASPVLPPCVHMSVGAGSRQG